MADARVDNALHEVDEDAAQDHDTRGHNDRPQYERDIDRLDSFYREPPQPGPIEHTLHQYHPSRANPHGRPTAYILNVYTDQLPMHVAAKTVQTLDPYFAKLPAGAQKDFVFDLDFMRYDGKLMALPAEGGRRTPQLSR